MKIGVVGYGKMGREIFELFHSICQTEKIVVVCRHDASLYESAITSSLQKSLKRKRISEDTYKVRSENFIVSQSLDDLKDCDIVVEAISENANEKCKLFSQIEKIVQPECILATNTSSVSIERIFTCISDKSRCLGVHFFYPVKFSSFIELNLHPDTSVETLASVQKIIQLSGKSSVVFRQKYHMYLNQFIMYCISTAILLNHKYEIGIKTGTDILSDLFPMHGIFGMIDSIGLSLLTTNESAFSLERLQPVVNYGRNMMAEWLRKGCPGESGEFINYFSAIETSEIPVEEIREKYIADMTAAIINEAVQAAQEVDEQECSNLIDALEKVSGLADSIKSYYRKYQYCGISERLADMAECYNMKTYIPADRVLCEKHL